ncbi:MAG: hypothetical protein KIG14_02535 [Candidatus Sacchiramonaceae bacterium]|nr:hypothetical protein [Candidatus Saccharimonadaceae bacterium]
MELFLLILIVAMLGYLILANDKVHFKKESARELLIDTSILIDGRFLAVAKTGFIAHKILIPRSVVGELQLLADGGDDDKRTRARYGLDIIAGLQHQKSLQVEILQDGATAREGVDNRLIKLAKERGAMICTADYNLNKVAKVEGIQVLNINELAQSVRANYLPGEKLMLELTGRGNEKKQAVGHLPDGTMVVVENAERLIDTVAEIEFIRMLQTAAGKMMFAKVAGESKSKSQTEQKANGRKQLPARAKAVKTTKTAKTKTETKPKATTKTTKSAQTSKKSTNQKPKTTRRRRSPEESMVELANR